MNYVIADRRSKSGAVITCRAKVNPAEHTGVLDLVQRGGKAGEASHHAPGIPSDDTLHDVSSPNHAPRICAAAPLTHECADGYSGNGGVVMSGVQFGSAAVWGFPSFAAC